MSGRNFVVGAGSEIGESCTLADGVVIGADCNLQDCVAVGANSVIADGVSIGRYAVIEPCSYIKDNIPPYAIASGNPARIVGYVNSTEIVSNAVKNEFVSEAGKTGAKIYNIPSFGDMRGKLGVLEWDKLLPFDVKRIFYTYDVPSSKVRGEHAHKKCEQFLISLHGSLNVIVDDGKYREEFVLDSSDKGLHLPSGCWGTQYKHSADCILLVCASHAYDPDDYIRDYDDFLAYKASLKTRN